MINHQILKEYLHYDFVTGIFTRVKSNRKDLISSVAGSVYPKGYVYITLNGYRYMAHRLAWLYVYKVWPNNQIDHINHIRTDNSISNLREVDALGNSRNRSKASNNTTGFNGITWNTKLNKWRVRIAVKRKRIHLGYFSNLTEAIAIQNQAKIDYEFHHNHGK